MKNHASKLLVASAALVPAVAAQAPSTMHHAPPTTTATCIDALHTTEMVYTAFYSTFFESASAIYNIFGDNNTLFVNDAPTTVILSTTLTTTIISTVTPAPPQSGVAFGAGLPAGRIDNTSTPFVLGYAIDPIAIIPTGFQTSGAPSTDPKQATLYTLPENMLAGLLMGGQFARNVGDAFNPLAPTTAMGSDLTTVYIQDGILHIVSAADGEGSFYACPDGLYVGFRSSPGPQCVGVVVGAIAASALGIQIPSRSNSMTMPMSTSISTPSVLLPISSFTTTSTLAITTTTPALTTTTRAVTTTSALPVGTDAVCPADDGQVVGNYNIYCGVGLDGVNIEAGTSQQPSLQACIDTCTASTAGCVSISYNRVTLFCYQHSTFATIETNIGGDFDSAEMVSAPPVPTTTSAAITTSSVQVTTPSVAITTPSVTSVTTTAAPTAPAGPLCPGSPDGTVFSGYAAFCGSTVNGGPDIVAAITDNVPSLEACIAICDRTQGCVGVSYMTGGSQTCYPHSEYNFAPTTNPNFNGAYNLNFPPGASVSSPAATTPALPTTTAALPTTSAIPGPAGTICPGSADATPYNGYLVFCGRTVNGGPDIASAITNDVATIEACIDICSRTPTCVGVSHMVSGSKTCYPHSGFNFAPVVNAAFDGAYLASQPPNAPAVPVPSVPLPLTSIIPPVGGLTSNLPVSAILSNPTGAVVSQLTSILSNPTAVVSAVAGATSALSGVVGGVTNILSNPTAAVPSIIRNPTTAIAPLVSAVTSVLPSPVATAVGSLTRSVVPVVTSALAPVSSVALPATSAVAPVASAVVPIVSSAPVVGSVAAPIIATTPAVGPVAPASSVAGGLPVGSVVPIGGGLGGIGGAVPTTPAGVSPTAGGPANVPTSQAQEYLPGAPYCTPDNGTYFGYEIHCERAITAPGVNAFGGNIPAVGTGNLPYQTPTLADCIALCNNVPTCVSISWHFAGTETVHECYLHNGDASFNIDIGYHSAIRLGTGSILLSQGNQGKTYAQGGGTAPVADPALAPYLQTPGVPPSSLNSFPTSTTPLIVTQTATPAPVPVATPPVGVLPGLNLKRMGYGLREESY